MELAPIYQDSKTGNRACQYEMNYIESVGLIKIDFLGIKNLRLIKDSIADIAKYHNKHIDIDNIPMDDKAVYKLFSEANTMGIFQFESDGMRKMLVDIAPTEFNDLVSSVALYRPGPLNSGMDKRYANIKNKREAITYEHPDLEPILGETQGVLIYQEQIMAISRTLGGFTPGKADELRKAMGKKIISMIDKLEEDFIKGGIERGYNEAMLKKIYAEMRGFGEYGFNKSHSVCYAMISYHQAYIKAHYPLEYYVSLLNTVIDDTDKIKQYLTEIQDKGIKIIEPSVLSSTAIFSQKDGSIVYSLNAIKNVGSYAATLIEEERENGGQFKSMEDFAKRLETHTINKKVYEALIKAGAFSCFDYSNQSLMDSVESILAFASSFQSEQKAGQNMLFDSVASADSSTLSIVKKGEYDNNILKEHELEILGFNFKYHVFINYPNLNLSKYDSLASIDNKNDNEEFFTPCVVLSFRDSTTKKGDPMLIVETEDTATIKTFFIVGENVNRFKYICMPSSGILVHGRREKSKYNDRVFTNIMNIHNLDDVIDGKVKINMPKRATKNTNAHAVNAKMMNISSNVNNANNSTSEMPSLYKSISSPNVKNIMGSNDKYVSIHLLKKTFDDMDLHCLMDTIEKHPGACPVVISLIDDVDENKYTPLLLGQKFCVNANENFMDNTQSIRSLLKISLQNS